MKPFLGDIAGRSPVKLFLLSSMGTYVLEKLHRIQPPTRQVVVIAATAASASNVSMELSVTLSPPCDDMHAHLPAGLTHQSVR